MELNNIFNDLIGKLSNNNCIKLGESLVEYGNNDKLMEEEKMNLYKILNSDSESAKYIKEMFVRLIDRLMEDSEINKNIISFLIREKEMLNELIDNIIYSDMEKELTNKDLNSINSAKQTINFIYDFIEKYDKEYE